MPRMRRRRWRGGRGEAACPRRIYRFVVPCLLLLLHRDPSHGYSLIEELSEFGFEETPIDPSVVYRYLREIEEKGLVTSAWQTEGGGGPPRRVYRITPDGDQYLAWWVRDLRETAKVLKRFLAAYEEHMEEDEGEHH